MKKIINENVVNAVTCNFPCKIIKNFTVISENFTNDIKGIIHLVFKSFQGIQTTYLMRDILGKDKRKYFRLSFSAFVRF